MIPNLTSYPQSCLFSNKFLRISVSFDNIVFYFIDKPDIIQIASEVFFFVLFLNGRKMWTSDFKSRLVGFNIGKNQKCNLL